MKGTHTHTIHVWCIYHTWMIWDRKTQIRSPMTTKPKKAFLPRIGIVWLSSTIPVAMRRHPNFLVNFKLNLPIYTMDTLLETYTYPPMNGLPMMICFFSRWDMLVPYRVGYISIRTRPSTQQADRFRVAREAAMCRWDFFWGWLRSDIGLVVWPWCRDTTGGNKILLWFREFLSVLMLVVIGCFCWSMFDNHSSHSIFYARMLGHQEREIFLAPEDFLHLLKVQVAWIGGSSASQEVDMEVLETSHPNERNDPQKRPLSIAKTSCNLQPSFFWGYIGFSVLTEYFTCLYNSYVWCFDSICVTVWAGILDSQNVYVSHWICSWFSPYHFLSDQFWKAHDVKALMSVLAISPHVLHKWLLHIYGDLDLWVLWQICWQKCMAWTP